jgi:hypothetical protein
MILTDREIKNSLPPEQPIIMTPQSNVMPSKPGSEGLPPLPPTAPLRVVMNGDRLDIQASVDLEGLKKLRVMLEKYQGILEMMQPDKAGSSRPCCGDADTLNEYG